MRPRMDLADVVLADGGSTDGSTDLPFLREAGVRALLVKMGPGRLGAPLRMGLAWALEQRSEGVVLVGGNARDDSRARALWPDSASRWWRCRCGASIPGAVPPPRRSACSGEAQRCCRRWRRRAWGDSIRDAGADRTQRIRRRQPARAGAIRRAVQLGERGRAA